MSGFSLYHTFVADTPNHLVQSVVEEVPLARGAALDLGAGNLRDSRFLKAAGFQHVVAVDRSEDSLPYASEDIELVIEQVEKYRLGRNRFDLIISCNTLFFVGKRDVEALMEKMYAALRSQGVLAFNILGDADPWAGDPRMSAFTRQEACYLTQRYKIESFGEVRRMLPLASGGQKFWHNWSLVLRKP